MATYSKGNVVEQALLQSSYNINVTDYLLYQTPSNERAIIRLNIATCSYIYCLVTFKHYDGFYGVVKHQPASITARQTSANKIIGKNTSGQDQYSVTYTSTDIPTIVVNEYTFELMPYDSLKITTNILNAGNMINLTMGIEKFRAS